VVRGEDEGAGETAKRGVWREEVLDLVDGGTSSKASQAADELDVPEVAGRQGVRLAATVQAEALNRPRPDLRDRQQATVVLGFGGTDAASGDLAPGADQGDRARRREVDRRQLRGRACCDRPRGRDVPQPPGVRMRRCVVGRARSAPQVDHPALDRRRP
jgi:hypothetical protein